MREKGGIFLLTMQGEKSELELTYSCILPRGKEKIVRVTFKQDNAYAEGIIPQGKIEKQEGFTQDEIKQLEEYLIENKEEIFKKAKAITGITHWF